MSAEIHKTHARVRLSFSRKSKFTILFLVAFSLSLINKLLLKNHVFRKKVIVVEPYGLGDIISLEPMVSRLVGDSFEVVLIGQNHWKDALENEITWWPTRAAWSSLSAVEIAKEFLRIRKMHLGASIGAIGIDPRGDARSIILLRLLGCSKIFSLDHYVGTDIKLPACLSTLVKEDLNKAKWSMNLEFAKIITGRNFSERRPSLSHLAPPSPPIDKQIGLVPIAPWPGKFWPSHHWLDLINRIGHCGNKLVIICGPKQREEVRSNYPNIDLPVLECVSLSELATAILSCSAVISVDSGPMHLAAALDVPVVGLFGTGQLPLWSPESSKSIAVTSRNFNSLAIHQIPANESMAREAMATIEPTSVIAALSSLLANHDKPSFDQFHEN